MTQFYDNPIQVTYRAAAFSLIAAATSMRFQGPPGKQGRLLHALVMITTQCTVAASSMRVGTGGTLTANLTMPVAISLVVNTGLAATAAQLKAGAIITADTMYEIGSGGGATAGAGDLVAVIGWY
jgi:hypothetical protein